MPEPDLYGLPLEEFIPARTAAARAIRQEGDRERAAVVAKLPKPSPAAWAANQVAREQPELIRELLDAGAGLRAAQDAAMSGSGGGLREATLAERRAVDAVMDAATGYQPAGKPLSRPMADRLRATLHAAAGDQAIRAAIAAGRLVSDASSGGAWPFALDAGEDMSAFLGAPPGTDEEAERAAAEEAERAALEVELKQARETLRVRERIASGAVAEAEAAQRALQEAQRALEAARDEAEAAERVAEEARAARRRARDDVARLEERLD